jgi:arsenite methyltransferase
MADQHPAGLLREQVREHYAAAATAAAATGTASCCGDCGGPVDMAEPALGAALYTDAERLQLPADAVAASLGCGNPLAVADLRAGETVLDLGSGGGIDVLLSARRVGPTGTAYGLDMTDEMLALARHNAEQAGAYTAPLQSHAYQVVEADTARDTADAFAAQGLPVRRLCQGWPLP